uniref:Signal transducing adapter molecule 1 n=1 Tax=Lygus hesperus TaxID=30085 RepID=A0A146LPD8_LYGHE
MSSLSLTTGLRRRQFETFQNEILMATHELTSAPDWTINMRIVKYLNTSRNFGVPTLTYLRRRLKHKNSQVQLLAITLLGCIVENCVYLRIHVATKPYMDFLLSTLPKYYLYRKKPTFFRRYKHDAVRAQYVDRV